MVPKDTTSTVEKKWMRKSIFRSIGTVHGQTRTVVVDGGSCENNISQALVDRLKLKVQKHYHPYFVKLLTTSDEMQVRHTCQITFAIGEDYKDIV